MSTKYYAFAIRGVFGPVYYMYDPDDPYSGMNVSYSQIIGNPDVTFLGKYGLTEG